MQTTSHNMTENNAPNDSPTTRRGPQPWVSDDDLVAIVREQTTERPVTITGDVTEATPYDYTTVIGRLHELVEDGRINRLSTGHGFVWWPADDEQTDEHTTDAEPETPQQ